MVKLLSSKIYCTFSLMSRVGNTGSETITINEGFTIKKDIFNSGFYNERTRYRIIGEVTRNKYTNVATVKIEAGDGKFFRISPYLKSGNRNIKLSLKSIEKRGEEIISYLYNLQYKNNRNAKQTDAIVTNIVYNNETSIADRSLSIDSFIVHDDIIPSTGVLGPIKILGTPNATFGVSIQEVDINNELLKFNILKNPNHQIIDNNGEVIDVLYKKISSKGIYKLNSRFPSIGKVTSLKSAVTGAKANISLNYNPGVRFGDKLIMKEIADGTNITVENVNDDGTINISDNITARPNSPISFQRQRRYHVNLIDSLTSTTSSKIPSSNPTYVINQYMDPTLTLKVSTAVATFKINGGGAGVEYYSYYKGRANSTPNSNLKQKSKYTLTYNLEVANTGSHTFTAARKPNFSHLVNHTISDSNPTGTATPSEEVKKVGGQKVSDWTNTTPRYNDGTSVIIDNITIGAIGATTLSITATLTILKWGISDITMELDLDKILTAGT